MSSFLEGEPNGLSQSVPAEPLPIEEEAPIVVVEPPRIILDIDGRYTVDGSEGDKKYVTRTSDR